MKRMLLIISLTLSIGAASATPIFNDPDEAAESEFSQGLELFYKKNLTGAVAHYRKAMSLKPDFVKAMTECGAVLLLLQLDSKEGMQLLYQAVQLDPKCDGAWLEIARANRALGNRDETIKACDEYLKLTPGGPNTEVINSWRIEQISKVNKTEIVRQNSGPSDYTGIFKIHTACRWPASAMPVKVFIADGSAVIGYTPANKAMLIAAFEAWKKVLVGKFDYVLITNPKEAQIICQWAPPNSPECAGEGGLTGCLRDPDAHEIKLARIVLSVVGGGYCEKPEYVLKMTALHEVGHALGLTDHSAFPDDIMFRCVSSPMTEPVLSERDIKTVNVLYSGDDKSFPAALEKN